MMLLVCATVVGLCCRRWFVLSLSDGVVATLCCGLFLLSLLRNVIVIGRVIWVFVRILPLFCWDLTKRRKLPQFL